jgi:hypothetical protein
MPIFFSTIFFSTIFLSVIFLSLLWTARLWERINDGGDRQNVKCKMQNEECGEERATNGKRHTACAGCITKRRQVREYLTYELPATKGKRHTACAGYIGAGGGRMQHEKCKLKIAKW